jgi:hypothetical protein
VSGDLVGQWGKVIARIMDDFAEQHTEPLRKALRRGGCQIDGDGHAPTTPPEASLPACLAPRGQDPNTPIHA